MRNPHAKYVNIHTQGWPATHTSVHTLYTLYTVFLLSKLPYIRSYTVCIYSYDPTLTQTIFCFAASFNLEPQSPGSWFCPPSPLLHSQLSSQSGNTKVDVLPDFITHTHTTQPFYKAKQVFELAK